MSRQGVGFCARVAADQVSHSNTIPTPCRMHTTSDNCPFESSMDPRATPIEQNPSRVQDAQTTRSSEYGLQTVSGTRAQWHVVSPEFASALAQEGDRLFEDDAPSGVRLVKTGAGRRVYAGEWGDERVVVKTYESHRWADRIRARIQGSHAEREWHLLRECQSRGIPVPAALAHGRSTKGRPRSALIMREIPDAVPLVEAWSRAMSPNSSASHRTAINLVDRVAYLLARAHQQGFAHPDGHPRNILIDFGKEGETPDAHYVDVYGGSLHSRGPISRPARVTALAQLDQFFFDKAPQSIRFRFLRRYRFHAGSRVGDQVDPTQRGLPHMKKAQRIQLLREAQKGIDGAWLRDVEYARKQIAARLARHRDRRLQKDGKYFATIRMAGGWKGQVVLQLGRRHRFPEPDVHDRSLTEWQALLAPIVHDKRDQQGDAAKGEADCIACKRIRAVGAVERMRWSLGRSPHQTAFNQAHRARHRDRAAPMVLGYLDRWSGGLIRESILILPPPGT